MFVPAATAWRMASEPEWAKVPSPRFWNTCAVPENGAAPTQCTPSPPICVRPTVCRSMVRAIEWQPMPPPASEPSGTTVERLCGQPEQKKDLRATASGAGRSLSASSSAACAVMEGAWIRRSSRRARISAIVSASSSPAAGTRTSPCSSRLPITRGRTACSKRMSRVYSSTKLRFSSMMSSSSRPRANSRMMPGSSGNSMRSWSSRTPNRRSASSSSPSARSASRTS